MDLDPVLKPSYKLLKEARPNLLAGTQIAEKEKA